MCKLRMLPLAAILTPLIFGAPNISLANNVITDPLWKVALDAPITSVMVTEQGTSIAVYEETTATPQIMGFYALDKNGNTITKQQASGSPEGIKPILAKDGTLYLSSFLPTGAPSGDKAGYALIEKFSAENNYINKEVIFKSDEVNYIHNIIFSKDYKNLYVTALKNIAGATPINRNVYALNNKNNTPGEYIWTTPLEGVFTFDAINSNGNQLFIGTDVRFGQDGGYLLDAETGKAGERQTTFTNASLTIQDEEGNVYSPRNLISNEIVKFNPFNHSTGPDWAWKNPHKEPNNDAKYYSVGLQSQLYEVYDDEINAVDRNTGNGLFRIVLPDSNPAATSGNRFTGLVITDPKTGWGYRSYIRKSPEASVGVLGFSPDGSQVRTIVDIKGDFNQVSAPALWNDRFYISVDREVYAYPLPAVEDITAKLLPQMNVDGNVFSDAERSQPQRISWEVTDKNNHRLDTASGKLEFDGSDPSLLNQFTWPLLVSNAINKQSGMLKAGPQQKNSEGERVPGTPLASQYLNWLWLPEDKVNDGYRVTLTTQALDHAPVSEWSLNSGSQQAFLSKEGDNFTGKIIRFTVQRARGEQHYDITTAAADRFAAAADIARKVNAAISDVQLGEKLTGNESTIIWSQYRNKIWVKEGVSVRYEVISQ